MTLKNLIKQNLKYLIEGLTDEEILRVINKINMQSDSDALYFMNHDFLKYLGLNKRRTIYLMGNTYLSPIEVRGYLIAFRIQKNLITSENVPYLQLLDVLSFFRKVQPGQLPDIFRKYESMLKSLNFEEKRILASLGKKYPSSVKAILSLLLRRTSEADLSYRLRVSINPKVFSKYETYVNTYVSYK